ncbi:hypothetical protein [Mesorhizobium sp. M00.F.Ca.ET.216.01.1.1]|uniref:hypothetical protein n=1 Tax=Mesorhizobium sp. M00.F.Ca.ET.216.01.1.1 TaxID=2500528 RepID=UPI001675EF90|nr:hypothetical protein [Mesorhizobium sp. M00.F.Ca.ET.216.01.1.1]
MKSRKQADLVVCEPTGGHEGLVLEGCLRAGIACHRADTLKLKSFIRSFGTLGKSDAIGKCCDHEMTWRGEIGGQPVSPHRLVEHVPGGLRHKGGIAWKQPRSSLCKISQVGLSILTFT